MVIFKFPWRQKTPKKLRPNCLLTRFPVCFFRDGNSFVDKFDPWRGIPKFLKEHGYEVKILRDLNDSKKFATPVHLFSSGVAALESLELLKENRDREFLASLTLVDPLFDFSEAVTVFLEEFETPRQFLIGILESSNNLDLGRRASQRIAKTWGPTFSKFNGTPAELQGHPTRSEVSVSAHSFFLQHCIFLAEYDLTAAK